MPGSAQTSRPALHSVVGVWEVTTKGAPFSYHMFVFHADGTMLQCNPPAGNTETSDTAGVGIWQAQPDGSIKAIFSEVRLGFEDGMVTRGRVSFRLQTVGDTLRGTWQLNVSEIATNTHLRGPYSGSLTGRRLTLD